MFYSVTTMLNFFSILLEGELTAKTDPFVEFAGIISYIGARRNSLILERRTAVRGETSWIFISVLV